VTTDGQTASWPSARVKRNNDIIVAYTTNGQEPSGQDFPLKPVGRDVGRTEVVRGIASITIR
jgi:hypothetical protein